MESSTLNQELAIGPEDLINQFESSLSEGLENTQENREQYINYMEAMALKAITEDESLNCDFPLTHTFTPGLYLRQMFAPKGSMVFSRRHLTEHPFIVLSGVADVFDEQNGSVTRISAPFVGISKVGARRFAHILEDLTWITAHATDMTDPDEIIDTITSHDNPMMPSDYVGPAFERKGRNK